MRHVLFLLVAVASTANAHQIVTPKDGLPAGWLVVKNEAQLKLVHPSTPNDLYFGLTALVCEVQDGDEPMVFGWFGDRWKELPEPMSSYELRKIAAHCAN